MAWLMMPFVGESRIGQDHFLVYVDVINLLQEKGFIKGLEAKHLCGSLSELFIADAPGAALRGMRAAPVVNGLVFNGSEMLHLPPEILPANRALQPGCFWMSSL